MKVIVIVFPDRVSEDVTSYIDIQSKGLRDILRVVLDGIKTISLMEDKPSVNEADLVLYLIRSLTWL
jgi:hypothetical protein